MSTIIRRAAGKKYENHTRVSDSWDLRTQIEALEEWMCANGTSLDPSSEWVADVGFTVRLTALGGGPPLSRKLMELCIAQNLEIFLSEYGAASE